MTVAATDSCRLCGVRRQQTILNDIVTSYHDRFALKKCETCSFVSVDPMPTNDLLERHYDQDYWQTEKAQKSRIVEIIYKLRMAKIVSAIREYSNYDSKILDWGCGDGSLIGLLRDHGLHCFGIDAYMAESNDPFISNTTIEKADFPEKSFDIITCFHVLEHLADPLNSIKRALKLAKTGGRLIVEVPNLDSLGYRIFKRRWQPLEIPTHLNHFTPATLQKVFASAGEVEIVKTEFFSHRISPSALVLSGFPSLAPRNIRKKNRGRYPLPILALYFFLQLLAYPPSVAEALAGRGEIIRMTVRTTG